MLEAVAISSNSGASTEVLLPSRSVCSCWRGDVDVGHQLNVEVASFLTAP